MGGALSSRTVDTRCLNKESGVDRVVILSDIFTVFESISQTDGNTPLHPLRSELVLDVSKAIC